MGLSPTHHRVDCNPLVPADFLREVALDAARGEARLQTIPKSFGFVVGEQLRSLFDLFCSKIPSFSLPGAAASSLAACEDEICAHQSSFQGRALIAFDADNAPLFLNVGLLPKHLFDKSTIPYVEQHLGFCRYGAIHPFLRIAESTEGAMGLPLLPQNVSPVIEEVFDHIIHNTEPEQPLDIALIIDTAYSMENGIEGVKDALIARLEHLKESSAMDVKAAVIEYKDKHSSFLVRSASTFEECVEAAIHSIKNLETREGDDTSRAAYDALIFAERTLSWREEAKRVALLISDAPPYQESAAGNDGEESVTQRLRLSKNGFTLYPILLGGMCNQ